MWVRVQGLGSSAPFGLEAWRGWELSVAILYILLFYRQGSRSLRALARVWVLMALQLTGGMHMGEDPPYG